MMSQPAAWNSSSIELAASATGIGGGLGPLARALGRGADIAMRLREEMHVGIARCIVDPRHGREQRADDGVGLRCFQLRKGFVELLFGARIQHIEAGAIVARARRRSGSRGTPERRTRSRPDCRASVA